MPQQISVDQLFARSSKRVRSAAREELEFRGHTDIGRRNIEIASVAASLLTSDDDVFSVVSRLPNVESPVRLEPLPDKLAVQLEVALQPYSSARRAALLTDLIDFGTYKTLSALPGELHTETSQMFCIEHGQRFAVECMPLIERPPVGDAVDWSALGDLIKGVPHGSVTLASETIKALAFGEADRPPEELAVSWTLMPGAKDLPVPLPPAVTQARNFTDDEYRFHVLATERELESLPGAVLDHFDNLLFAWSQGEAVIARIDYPDGKHCGIAAWQQSDRLLPSSFVEFELDDTPTSGLRVDSSELDANALTLCKMVTDRWASTPALSRPGLV